MRQLLRSGNHEATCWVVPGALTVAELGIMQFLIGYGFLLSSHDPLNRRVPFLHWFWHWSCGGSYLPIGRLYNLFKKRSLSDFEDYCSAWSLHDFSESCAVSTNYEMYIYMKMPNTLKLIEWIELSVPFYHHVALTIISCPWLQVPRWHVPTMRWTQTDPVS